MKKGLIITTALAMVLGAGVAVGAHQAKTQRVEAATSTTVYYAVSSSVVGTYTVKLNVNFKGDGNDWHQYTMNKETDTFDGKDVYSYTYTDAYDGVGVMQFQLYDGETWIMQQEPINSWTTVGNYNGKVWVHNDGWYTYTPDVPGESVYKFKINSGTVTTMEEGDDGQVVSEEIKFDKGDQLTFYKDDVELEAVPKDDAQLTKVFKNNNNKLEFAQDYTGVLYLKKTGAKLWAGQFTAGYYLAGVDGEWEPKLATPAAAHEDSYLVSNIHLAADTEVKFIQAPDNGGFNWFNADTSKITIGEGVSASVITESGLSYGNLKVEADGDYDLYYTPENGWYSIYKYVEPAPDPVYTISVGFCDGTFENDDEHKPEGSLHQFKATVEGYSWRAREVKFYKDDVEITSNIGVDYDGDHPTAGNNIVGDVTNGFKVYTSKQNMVVYLKQYSEGYSIWAEGYSENVYYISWYNRPLNLDEDYVQEEGSPYIKQYKTSSELSMIVRSSAEDKYGFIDGAGGQQDINIETAGQNNAFATSSSSFNLHNDCNEIIYLKMKADLSLWVYIGGYFEEHTLDIGDDTYNLVKLDDNQYWLHDVELSAGDQFGAYKIEGAVVDVDSEESANNNLTAGLKVIVDAPHADIYYKVDSQELFVSGLPSDGQHILKNGHELIETTKVDDFEGFEQYQSRLESFAANDTIEVIDVTGRGSSRATIWQITKINEAGHGSNFTVDGGKIKCVTACSTYVYLKIKTGENEVYFGDVPEYVEEAINFANAFKAAMATACSASGKQTAVEAAWSAKASEYALLSEEARGELYLGGYSDYNEIVEFGKRYMGIKQQHPDWELANFLDWDIPTSPAFIPAGEQNSVSKNANVLIIIVAAVSVISLASLVFIKKRKHK